VQTQPAIAETQSVSARGCSIMYDSKKMYDTAGTVAGEEAAIFSDVYRKAKVWDVFSPIGEPHEKRLARRPATR